MLKVSQTQAALWVIVMPHACTLTPLFYFFIYFFSEDSQSTGATSREEIGCSDEKAEAQEETVGLGDLRMAEKSPEG